MGKLLFDSGRDWSMPHDKIVDASLLTCMRAEKADSVMRNKRARVIAAARPQVVIQWLLLIPRFVSWQSIRSTLPKWHVAILRKLKIARSHPHPCNRRTQPS